MLLKILLVVAIAAALGVASGQGGQNCESSCGKVTITYPFGSGEGCYYSSDFLVTCNRSSSVEQPVLLFGSNTSTAVISNMSTIKGEVELMMFVGRDCYRSTGKRTRQPSLKLRDVRISTKNKFVAIGCDTSAYFQGNRSDEIDGTGCMSRCGRNSSFTNGSCSGVGCCEVAVPQGLQNFQMTLGSVFVNSSNITDFSPCSYAFFVEQGKFSFSTTNLLDFRNVSKMPMLLDWAIGNQTCDQVKDMDGFLCKGTSKCDQNYTGPVLGNLG